MGPHHVLTQLMPPTERMSRQLRVFRATWCCLHVNLSSSHAFGLSKAAGAAWSPIT